MRKAFEALEGRIVARWEGVEMAVRDHEGLLPQWYDESIPALQLAVFYVILSDESSLRIHTYQNDDLYGLMVEEELTPRQPEANEPNSIFRFRVLRELPCGQISEMSVNLCDGDIASVQFKIAEHQVRLWAGEVYEDDSGALTLRGMDESVMVSVDGRRPCDPGGFA